MFRYTLKPKAIKKRAVQIVLYYEIQQQTVTFENSPGTYVI